MDLAFLVEFIIELTGAKVDMEMVDFDIILLLEGSVVLSQVTTRSDPFKYPFLEFDGGREEFLLFVLAEFRDPPDMALGDDEEVSRHQTGIARDDHDENTFLDN